MRKGGAGLDLPIAVGLLVAIDELAADELRKGFNRASRYAEDLKRRRYLGEHDDTDSSSDHERLPAMGYEESLCTGGSLGALR